MKTPVAILAIAVALSLAPTVTSHADAPAAEAEVSAPAQLQPWESDALQAFLTVGTKLEWEQQCSRWIFGQRVVKHPTIEVLAATDEAVTLRCTTQVAFENTTGFDLKQVTWEEELAWDEAAVRLCQHLPLAAAAGEPSHVEIELEGAKRNADFYVVERADGADRFWFSVDRPGLLLKFERETHCDVRINGEVVSFRRVTESITAVGIDDSAVVLAPTK